MDSQKHRGTIALGTATAIGAGIGAALFAGSDNPVWIGLGAGLGVLLWALRQRSRG